MTSVRTKGKRKEHHSNYLIQFNENFIRNNTEQQKQDMEIFMPLENDLYVPAVKGEKRNPWYIFCYIRTEKRTIQSSHKPKTQVRHMSRRRKKSHLPLITGSFLL